MGLFDTVLSTNKSGYSYNLTIPAAFEYVAHAVALNEYRGHVLPVGRANFFDPNSWGAFPLQSIGGETAPSGRTRIELGFIGAHAGIGGGFQDNELSKVALAWMLKQAQKAGVQLKNAAVSISYNPVLHDKSDAIRFGSPISGTSINKDASWNADYYIPPQSQPGSGAEDRKVLYNNPSLNTTQRLMLGIGMSYADTGQFISFDPQRRRSDNVTGTVDAISYIAWLRDHGYGLADLTLK